MRERTPCLGWKGLNHPQTGSLLQGWISGLVGARGLTVLGSHLTPSVSIGEPRWLPLMSCSSRGEMGVLSRLGAKGPLQVYPWAGVDSSIGLHPSLSSRANLHTVTPALPSTTLCGGFQHPSRYSPAPHPCAAPAARKLPVPNPGKFRGYFALG